MRGNGKYAWMDPFAGGTARPCDIRSQPKHIKTPLLPTLALASAAALAQLQAATTENPIDRRDLSGGTRVTARAAPFLVFLETNYGRYYGGCLGTLISTSWIVTAAHCIDAAGGRQITVRHISGYE